MISLVNQISFYCAYYSYFSGDYSIIWFPKNVSCYDIIQIATVRMHLCVVIFFWTGCKISSGIARLLQMVGH